MRKENTTDTRTLRYYPACNTIHACFNADHIYDKSVLHWRRNFPYNIHCQKFKMYFNGVMHLTKGRKVKLRPREIAQIVALQLKDEIGKQPFNP